MAVQTFPTAVNTTAVPIYTYSPALFAAAGTAPMVISNLGAQAVFVGPKGVTTTTGVQIPAGANLQLSTLDDTLYAISTAAATVVVGVFS